MLSHNRRGNSLLDDRGRDSGTDSCTCEKKRDYTAQILSRYEKDWIKAIGSNLKWGRWLQKKMVESTSGGLGTSLMGSDRSCKIVAEMLVGARSVRATLLAAAPICMAKKLRR